MTRGCRIGVFAVLAFALGAGCAAPRPATPPLSPVERQTLMEQGQTIERLEQALGALPMAGAPDCDRACFLSQNICALAGRICDIAGRHPDDNEAQQRCQDAEARCRRARERATQRCVCR